MHEIARIAGAAKADRLAGRRRAAQSALFLFRLTLTTSPAPKELVRSIHSKSVGSPTIVKSFFIPLADVTWCRWATSFAPVIHARFKQHLGALGWVWCPLRSDIDPGVPVATRNIRRNTNGYAFPT